MTDTAPQSPKTQSEQSVAMLRERLDRQEMQIKELWRRIHSLSETIEQRPIGK